MAISKTFTDWALKLHTMTAQSGGAVYVAGISEQSVNLNLQTQTEGGDGSVYDSFGYLSEGAPVARLSTLDLKQFLDECGAAGMLIDADGTHPGVVLYFQRNKQGGTREVAAASNHISWTVENGILVPRTLELPHRGPARLTVEVIARKDGSTAPVQASITADLPAGVNPTISAVHGIGPVNLNAGNVTGLRGCTIDFGIEVQVEAGDGETYPTFVTIGAIRPTITLESVHTDIIDTLSVDGAYYTASQVVVYARKKSEGGAFVADGTAEHLSFTLGKCRVQTEEIGAGLANLMLTPWATPGSVNPVTVNTATQIT